ncbi:MAG: hypothetical protein COU07_02860 [Candidatus Harrisonbacteria bacterium CG10_big_fil_rev_8_21_14_0_10_40_38]|uniref:Uncharacterized protein n=1 Tax=Candidatus Harrisonbacteria bacterium CG10_big_fil_rev_8_21_14_0_10_40_38 TaxID=1974583 RepID=A0A2H0UU21_9BACT|nr:MAG: hypothetical protein COU07_02860 [Candidatus Harrisonbacteria bacterium CG10_big_fil_rev_8_21_14_0_10_40_38]
MSSDKKVSEWGFFKAGDYVFCKGNLAIVLARERNKVPSGCMPIRKDGDKRKKVICVPIDDVSIINVRNNRR